MLASNGAEKLSIGSQLHLPIDDKTLCLIRNWTLSALQIFIVSSKTIGIIVRLMVSLDMLSFVIIALLLRKFFSLRSLLFSCVYKWVGTCTCWLCEDISNSKKSNWLWLIFFLPSLTKSHGNFIAFSYAVDLRKIIWATICARRAIWQVWYRTEYYNSWIENLISRVKSIFCKILKNVPNKPQRLPTSKLHVPNYLLYCEVWCFRIVTVTNLGLFQQLRNILQMFWVSIELIHVWPACSETQYIWTLYRVSQK